MADKSSILSSSTLSLPQSDVSWATETPESPGAPRTLTREIDHIKHLIARSQRAPRQAENSITAQVFRRRSSAQEHVPPDRIIHELDQLKRRIRHEQHQWRKPSEVDPDTESEGDGEDVLDERDEELERVREELTLVRRQREEWLEAAENRIDKLINDKEGLADLLRTNREELKQTRLDKGALEKSLRAAEQKIEALDQQIVDVWNDLEAARTELSSVRIAHQDALKSLESEQKDKAELASRLDSMQSSLDEVKTQLESVKAEKDTADAAARRAEEHASSLEKAHENTQTELAKSNELISALEEKNEQAAEHLRKTIDEHSTADRASKEQLRALQERHDNVTGEAKRLQNRVDELAGQLIEAETAAINSQDVHEEQRKKLAVEVEEHKKRLEEALRDVEKHEEEVKQIIVDRDAARTQVEHLIREQNERKAKLEETLRELEKREQELQQTAADRDSARSQVESLRRDRDEHNAKLEEALRDVERRQEEIKGLAMDRDIARSAVDRLEKERDEHKAQFEAALTDKDTSLREAEEKQRAVEHKYQEQLSRYQKDHEQLNGLLKEAERARAEDLDNVNVAHGRQVRALSDEHETERKHLRDAMDTTISELEHIRLDYESQIEFGQNELEFLRNSEKGQIAEQERLQRELESAKGLHSKQLESLRIEHDHQLKVLREQLDASSQSASDAHEKSQTKLAELAGRLATETKQSTSLREKLQQAEESHYQRVKDLEASLTETEQNVEAAEKRAFQLAESGKAREAELGEEITNKSNALAEARERLSELQKKLDRSVLELAETKVKLAAAIDNAETRISEIEKTHAASLHDLSEQHAKDLEHREQQHSAEIERLQADAHRAAQMTQERADAMDELQRTHQEALDGTKRAADARILELDELHARETERLVAEHAAALDKARRDAESLHDTTTEGIRSESEKRLLEALERHRAEVQKLQSEIETLKAEYEAATHIIRAENEKRLLEASEKHKAEVQELQSNIEKLKEDHQAANQKAKSEGEQRLSEALDKHRTEVQELQSQIEKLRQEHRAAIDKANQALRSELQCLKDEHEAATKKINSEHEDLVARLSAERATERGATLDEHKREVQDLQSQIDGLKQEHRIALEKASHDLQLQRQSLRDEHEAAMYDASQEHKAAFGCLAAEHAAEREASDSQTRRRLDEMEAIHTAAIEALRTEHQSTAQRTSQEHERAITELRAKFETDKEVTALGYQKQLDGLRSSHLSEVSALREQAAIASQKATQDHQAALDSERKAERARSEREIDNLRASYAAEVAALREAYHTKSEKARQEAENALTELSVEHQKERRTAEFDAERRARDLQAKHTSEIAGLKAEHARAIETTSTESRQALKDAEARAQSLQESYQVALFELRNNHGQQVDELCRKHQTAFEEQRTAHGSHITGLEARHNQALSNLKAEHERRVRELEAVWASRADEAAKSHRAELERAADISSRGASTSRDGYEKLLAARDAVAESLRKELRQSSERHQREMQRSNEERQEALAGLSQKLHDAVQRLDGLLAKQEKMTAENAALQARLDAELTSHAEAERALAEIRKQQVDDGSKDEFKKSSWSSQKEHAPYSPSSAQETSATSENENQTTDSAALKKQLALAKQERKEAEALVQRKLGEKSELVHQNEFLVKEVESLMTQMSTPKSPCSNAEVQTDPVISLPRSPKSSNYSDNRLSAPADSVLEESKDSRSTDAGAPNSARAEQNTGMATLRSTKGKPNNIPRPKEPPTPVNRVPNNKDGRARNAPSFEDYLKQAQTELSELGSVITANEALFAQKIQEHVGELQRAKNQLAAEYRHKFDSLAAQKKRLEENVHYQEAEDFGRTSNDLSAGSGTESDEPETPPPVYPSPPTKQAKTLRTAEERFVKEYKRRIAQRKSQVAAKHTEELQSLIQNSDRKTQGLLLDKQGLDGNLPIESRRLEHGLGELPRKSLQLERESTSSVASSPRSSKLPKNFVDNVPSPEIVREVENLVRNASVSQLQQRFSSSLQGTPTSLPRIRPLHGNRHSIDVTPRPRSPLTPSNDNTLTSEHYPPVTQRSLIRTKSPHDSLMSQRSASTPRSTDNWTPSPFPNDLSTQDFAVKPPVFTQRPLYKLMPPLEEMPKTPKNGVSRLRQH